MKKTSDIFPRRCEKISEVFSGKLARTALLIVAVAAVLAPGALAQETQQQELELRRKALATLPKDAARRQFGAIEEAAPGSASVVGDYWKGCFSGGLRLPAAGTHWQTMRRSRNRHWGHPRLITFLEKYAKKVAEVTGWSGILIGDMSQPHGGPMLTGHASHQLGIEADIWLRPMPATRFDERQVEEVLSTDLLRADRKDVDPAKYMPQHLAMLRIAAESPEVARVFVNAAIKKALCRDAGEDRAWLRKIRPAYGHSYHFHIRLACPESDPACNDQPPPPPGDGCGKDLAWWLTDSVVNTPLTGGGRKSISVAAMPKACQVLAASAPKRSGGGDASARRGDDAETPARGAAGASAARSTDPSARTAAAKR